MLPAASTPVAEYGKVPTESHTDRTSEQELKDRIGQVVCCPEGACGAIATHGGTMIEGCPWRPARSSNPTRTNAWTMMSVLTTAAIVAEPPVAALVPDAAS